MIFFRHRSIYRFLLSRAALSPTRFPRPDHARTCVADAANTATADTPGCSDADVTDTADTNAAAADAAAAGHTADDATAAKAGGSANADRSGSHLRRAAELHDRGEQRHVHADLRERIHEDRGARLGPRSHGVSALWVCRPRRATATIRLNGAEDSWVTRSDTGGSHGQHDLQHRRDRSAAGTPETGSGSYQGHARLPAPFGYAAKASVVTKSRITGHPQFNVSEVAGTFIVAGAGNLYYPQAQHTMSDTLTRWAMQAMWDSVSNETQGILAGHQTQVTWRVGQRACGSSS